MQITLDDGRVLDNQATPRYYGEFRDRVLRGEIPVCNEISMEMNRIDQLIANPYYWVDQAAMDGWVMFAETECTLTDGQPLTLLPSFKLWAEQCLVWHYFKRQTVFVPDGLGGGNYEIRDVVKRLVKKQYLIVARGAAKSMYGSIWQSYGLNVDPDTTHQITTAPTMRQAEEVMSPIRTAIARALGPLFKFLTLGSLQNTTGSRALRTQLAATKKGIENFFTTSLLEIRPMAINKLQGLRCKYATVDEWLSGDLREDVVGAIEQGSTKLPDYLILAFSSEGTVRNGAGDTMKMELARILKGEYIAPHISIWHYKLDDIKEVGDPSKWEKANPNIGLTVSFEDYALDVERAENTPHARNDILAKRFGIPSAGHTYFFTYEETIPHKTQTMNGRSCSVGADLSMGDDFCAFTLLFPLSRERFGIKARAYITEQTMKKQPSAQALLYEEFINEGTLIVMPGTILDMEDVADDLFAWMAAEGYEPECLGYDPYNSKEFLAKYIGEYGPYGIEKVIQGARTESVPLGELKNLSEDRLLLFDEAIMQFAMGNAVVEVDTNGNMKLLKLRYDEKIDNVSAMMDAFVAYKLFKDLF